MTHYIAELPDVTSPLLPGPAAIPTGARSDYVNFSTGEATGQAPQTAAPKAFVGALGPHLPPLAAQPTTALDAALRLAAAGLPVFPSHPEGTFRKDKKTGEVIDISKTPAIGRWQFQATTDPVQVRRWWVAGGRYSGCGVSIGLRLAQLVAVDPDTPEAAEILAEHGDALGVGFAVASAKGAKMLYRRPDRLADQNGVKVKAAALGGADAVTGNVLAWSPGRVWYGDPSAIGEAPEWLLTALATIYPERAEPAPLPPRPARPAGGGDVGRLVAYVLRAIIDECAKVAGLGDGRKMAMFILGVKLGALVSGIAPQLEGDAWAEAERAACACGVGLGVGMPHFRNGWRYGAANPRPIPPEREIGLGALPPQERATLEGRIAAATADVMAQAKGVGCRAQQAETVRSVVAALAEVIREHGSETAIIGVESLARLAKRGAGSVHRAVIILEALGWTVARGGIGADDRVMATRWTLPASGSRAFGHPGMDAVTTLGGSCLAPFRDDQKVGGTAYGLGATVGPTMRRIAAVMATGAVMTADQVAAAARTTPKTAARCLTRMEDAALATVATVSTAGRPARCWALAADVLRDLAGDVAEVASDALQMVRRAAARFEARATARIEGGRRILAAAREYARQIGASVAAVLKAWRDRDRRMAAAERDPLRDAGSSAVAAAHRAEARAQLRDGAARRDWARAMTTRDLVAEIGLATTW